MPSSSVCCRAQGAGLWGMCRRRGGQQEVMHRDPRRTFGFPSGNPTPPPTQQQQQQQEQQQQEQQQQEQQQQEQQRSPSQS
ncbi:putative mediator of RNA polymerase II transcription subunit 21 [Engraulis encrasicolus]|uniref:putative mediator of RNA polymerase II transcription subunit 21 n=1 Tax=Engraulis encrasicolus TaxID=184585 RepID=UPI002FCF8D9A